MTGITRRRLLRRTGGVTTGAAVLGGAAGGATAGGMPVISTRGHYDTDTGELNDGYSHWDFETNGAVPGIDTGCVDDMTVFVHGWRNDESEAHDKMHEAKDSLVGAGYSGTVCGYTWDSDTGNDWGDGEQIAQGNGYALAHALVQFKENCPGSAVRVVIHSLGAQVLLKALRVLDGWSRWEDPGFRVTSTHLLGAAQDNEAPTDEWPDTARAIRQETTASFNYFSEEDDTLEWIYNTYEFDQALGETGAEAGNETPCNYHDYDATSQVGDCHSCYLDTLGDEMVYHMAHVGWYTC